MGRAGCVFCSFFFETGMNVVVKTAISYISFWNNSATVREGVTKFEMPRQKLLKKCLFLFIAPFDLARIHVPTCAVTTITEEK